MRKASVQIVAWFYWQCPDCGKAWTAPLSSRTLTCGLSGMPSAQTGCGKVFGIKKEQKWMKTPKACGPAPPSLPSRS